MDTLWRVIERNAWNYKEEVALRYPAGHQILTWDDLYREAFHLAQYLKSKGIKAQQKIALLSPNKPEFVLGFLAAQALEAIIVPINVRLTSREIHGILMDCNANYLLFEENLQEKIEELKAGDFSITDLQTIKISPRIHSETPSEFDSPLPSHFPPSLNESELSNRTTEILYTSGTTGKPKGVMLSHQAVLSVAKIMAYEANIRARDNCLILMPLTHSAPLNLFLWGAFWAGASITIGEFAPETLLNSVANEKTTHFFGAPVVYQLVSKIPNLSSWDLSSMKLWIYGGASVGHELIRSWQKALPGQFMGVYGLTEAGPNGAALHPEEHTHKVGSIGRSGTANTEIRVVRANGQDTDPREPGELILRTESLMQGYYGNPAATEEVLREGWLYTGDIAFRDEEQYVWILDRKKDMIITGGVNVYPKEIEDVLATHPQIADIAVYGIPHLDWGETVVAQVVLRTKDTLTLENLQEYCQDKLADYKIPRVLKVVDGLPRNASGKILKHVLRAQEGSK